MKVFICVGSIVDIGGISSALVNLLNEISSNNSITLCAINNYISSNKNLPNNIRVISGSDFLQDCFVDRTKLNNQNIIRKIIRNCRRIERKIFGREWAIHKGVKNIKITDFYDVAIAFSNDLFDKNGNIINGGNYELVASGINASRKIAWIHNDARECGFTTEICNSIFSNFDAIVNVSYFCKNIFDEISPNTISKSTVVYNLYDIERIKSMAGDISPYAINGKVHFVTVCRLNNYQKRVDRIIDVIKKLKELGYSCFDWTIVGDGNDRFSIESSIHNYNLTDTVYMTGLLSNPYPFIKFADAFVLASKFEGLPVTVKEAQILGVPALITNFGAAHEAVEDGENGLICVNSTDGLFNLIKSVLDDKKVLSDLKLKLKEKPVDNSIAINQFVNVCNGEMH